MTTPMVGIRFINPEEAGVIPDLDLLLINKFKIILQELLSSGFEKDLDKIFKCYHGYSDILYYMK